MKTKIIVLGVIVVATTVWYFYPSEYDRLMSAALKKKSINSEVKIFDGEVEPSVPDSIQGNKTVLGIDTNKNGIRDDIDIWINRTALDYNERMAMRQYARAKQYWLKVCSEKLVDDVMRAENDVLNSGTCLYAVVDYQYVKSGQIENIINLLTKNTNIRDCGKFYNEHSTVVSIINGSDPHLNCKFEIEKLGEVIKSYRKSWEGEK